MHPDRDWLALDEEDDQDEKDVAGQYISLVSGDGFEFIVERSVARCSSTIEALLNGPDSCWKELSGPLATLRLDNASGFVLEKVVQYFYHRAAGLGESEFPIEMEYVFPLLNLSHYLGV
jgi:elongin-C